MMPLILKFSDSPALRLPMKSTPTHSPFAYPVRVTEDTLLSARTVPVIETVAEPDVHSILMRAKGVHWERTRGCTGFLEAV